MVSSTRSNILFYAVLGGLGAVGLLALLATGSVSPQNLKGLLIALSNAFGLIAGMWVHLCFCSKHWASTGCLLVTASGLIAGTEAYPKLVSSNS